ncbi:MAG: DVU0524 family FlgM-associated protein [Pseudomonadota bacterium]
MVVNNRHIQNVLQAYGRQLNRNCNKNQVKQDEQLEQNDRISISSEAKRKQVISTTASELIDRIVSNPANQEMETQSNREVPSKSGTGRIGITFKEVDEQKGETLRHIDSDNSDYLRSLFNTTANTLA